MAQAGRPGNRHAPGGAGKSLGGMRLPGMSATFYHGLGINVAPPWRFQNPVLNGYSGIMAYLPDRRLSIAIVSTTGPSLRTAMSGSRNRATRSMAFRQLLHARLAAIALVGRRLDSVERQRGHHHGVPAQRISIHAASPPSALIMSPRRRASAGTSVISASDRPLLLAACRFLGGLRFRVDAEAGVFAGHGHRISPDAGPFAL
jgi:hypothetical protein